VLCTAKFLSCDIQISGNPDNLALQNSPKTRFSLTEKKILYQQAVLGDMSNKACLQVHIYINCRGISWPLVFCSIHYPYEESR